MQVAALMVVASVRSLALSRAFGTGRQRPGGVGTPPLLTADGNGNGDGERPGGAGVPPLLTADGNGHGERAGGPDAKHLP